MTENNTCKNCGFRNISGANFCGNCRHLLAPEKVSGIAATGQPTCPHCDEVVPEGAAYCRHCGQAINGKKGNPVLLVLLLITGAAIVFVIIGIFSNIRDDGQADISQTATAVASLLLTSTAEMATPDDTPSTTPSHTPFPTDTVTATLLPTQTMAPTLTPYPTNTATAVPTPTVGPRVVVCPGAFPTRLSIGQTAVTVNFQLNVREGPGTRYGIVNRLQPNRRVEILQGPECEGEQLWYYIRTEEFTNRSGETVRVEGWAVEESGSTWFLEPVD